jgi:hypothetical protein
MSATATVRWRCWAGWIGGACRGCAPAGWFIHLAMIQLLVRRLARS